MTELTDSEPLRTHFGPFRLDEAEALLERDGQPVEVPPRAFQVLCELARRPGQLVAKDALIDAVWGHHHLNESALKNIVSQLRQALGDDAREPRIIQTASRRGYRFIATLAQDVAARANAATNSATPPVTAGALPAPDPTLVGRERALAKMSAAWAAAQRQQRQLVFVLGEAGTGKSTLVEHFVAASGALVAFGQCIEHYGSGEPYMPILEALNTLCRLPDGNHLIRSMREVAPTWLLQMPWFVSDEDRRQLQREAAGATQDRMLREFGELVDRMPREASVLLVLEDLHWCDHATVQLLGYLAHRRGPAGLMVLGTLRPTELVLEEHPLGSLRQQLRARRLSVEIDLESLSEADIGALLAARFDDEAPEAFVRSLHAHTSGLPLFVVNVVDELVSDGTLVRQEGRWRFPDAAALPVPRDVHALIETQIARLPAEHQRALAAASVSGVEFLDGPLGEVLGMPADRLQVLLEDATRRVSWLHSAGVRSLEGGRICTRYAFAHTMYRHVLYQRHAQAQRLQWHRQWAAALGVAYGSSAGEMASELALHFERGQLPVAAAEQLSIVATRALERGAAVEARAAAQHGLLLGTGQLTKALELELRVLEGVALTRLHVLAHPQVAKAFSQALALQAESAPAWPRALQGAWWVHYARGELDEARSLASQMLALADTGDTALRLAAHNALGIVNLLSGDISRARDELESAFELHAREGMHLPPTHYVQDPGVEVACGLALACWFAGEPQRARNLARQAAQRAATSHHALSELTALSAQAILHALAREFDTVHQLTERLYTLIRDHGLPPERSDFAWLHGHSLVARGQVAEGLQEMREAANSAEEFGMRSGLCGFHHHHAQACLEAGQTARARASIEEGIALGERLGGHTVLPGLLAQRAEMLAVAGEQDAATAAFHKAIACARQRGSAFFELLALAAAQRLRNPAGDPARLRELLALYDGDPSPGIAAIRDATGQA
ncbi:AAA family ATPase [Hydrogenophaga sp.]|uniref:ATP-binding protein n=1 Tax=Hydrogenophaga sp. TaxID=1904254 RepID=UPI0025BA5893|nr:AAA family ATPase [Hydrogenophaga sp.]MBT9465603.1 AAA family ATPase [Hydrogenophaga sp.]